MIHISKLVVKGGLWVKKVADEEMVTMFIAPQRRHIHIM